MSVNSNGCDCIRPCIDSTSRARERTDRVAQSIPRNSSSRAPRIRNAAKWVNGIQFTERDEAGFWELRGYHMYGDPWRQQRYTND